MVREAGLGAARYADGLQGLAEREGVAELRSLADAWRLSQEQGLPLGPAMLERGYTKGYAAATIAVGSLITATIPPSIGLILYGYLGEVSIGRLFIAGVVPGFLLMVALMVTTFFVAKRRG